MEHKENEHEIKNLSALSSSVFAVKDGQPDIIKWKVVNSAQQFIGTITDLLFDREQQKVRYLVLNLKGNVWHIEEREVLIPVGVAELNKDTEQATLPNITAQQISVLPDYKKGNSIVSTDSEVYGHKDFDEASEDAKKSHGSYTDHIPYQIITKVYQEENKAETAYRLLISNGFTEGDIKITIYNPLNGVTDLLGNKNTDYTGDGSRDEYILSLAANTAAEATLAHLLLNNNDA
ncbi:PRC-barrel domain-containing protein [Pedobacter lusitanus]|uniref:PRC-barrel domain-containing protein n=1 Tax=Pedobacter lusitanus TaxID=1503925 RepID=UPI0032AF6659